MHARLYAVVLALHMGLLTASPIPGESAHIDTHCGLYR